MVEIMTKSRLFLVADLPLNLIRFIIIGRDNINK
jgi:hypothetical protein